MEVAEGVETKFPLDELGALARAVGQLKPHDLEKGWSRISDELSRLLGSHGTFAIVFSRIEGLFQGWCPSLRLEHGEGQAARHRFCDMWNADPACHVDPYALTLFDAMGTPRVFRSKDLLDHIGSQDSPSYNLLGENGLADRLVATCPISDDTEIHFGFDRRVGEKSFSFHDYQLAQLAGLMLKRSARWLALAHGLYPQAAPLSPRERSVLGSLLHGASEKQIASDLGMTTGSAHQVVVRLYRKFGVQSRPELMSLWL